MTPELAIAHVEESIAKALRGESYLSPSVLDIKGFATATQRHLVSNLAHLPKDDPCYLEVGLYAGATFCAAISNNAGLTAIGVENWSQSFGDNTIKAQFEKNLNLYSMVEERCDPLKGRAILISEKDCFEMKWPFYIQRRVDLYYYDGEHSLESQAKALPYFIEQMADMFIFMVDDYSWPSVAEGTRWGFEILSKRIKIEHEWVLSDGKADGPRWHNDVALFVTRKT